MSVRNFLLILAITSVISFTIAQTASIFAGQHVWYDLSGVGSDVPCEKCHADVKEEMESMIGPHTGETGYGRMKCEFCHRTFPIAITTSSGSHINQSIYDAYYHTYAYVNDTKVQSGKEAHAASTVACMYCHSGGVKGIAHAAGNMNCFDSGCHPEEGHGHDKPEYFDVEDCWACHVGDNPEVYPSSPEVYYIPPAGGFGLTHYSGDTGRNASHLSFVLSAIENEMMEDANEACIACHTKMSVEIWFNVTTEAKITVNNSYNQSYSYWDVEEITPSNYTTYKEVKGE